MQVQEILSMTRHDRVTIHQEALLAEAAQLLSNGRVDLVVVCEDADRMVGVVTRTDVVFRVGRYHGQVGRTPVAEVMTRAVFYCRPEDSLETVWQGMKAKRHVHVPVIDQEERPLGILTAREVLQALLRDSQYENDLLRDYVMGVGY